MLIRLLATGVAASCAAVLSIPLPLAPALADESGSVITDAPVTLAAPAGARLDYGASLTEATILRDAGTTLPLAGVTVRLLGKVTGKPFTEVATTVTDDQGAASVTVAPELNTTYEWVFDGDAAHAAGTSSRGVAKVAVLIDGALTKMYVRPRHRTTVYGVLHPALPGTTVVLQRQESGSWHQVASTVTESRWLPDRTHQVGYLMRFYPPSKGAFNLRVVVPVVPLLAKATPLRLQVSAY